VRMIAIVFSCALILYCPGQSRLASTEKQQHRRPDGVIAPRELVASQTIRAKSEMAESLYEPLRCDGDGNIYFQKYSYAVPTLRKLSPKGEALADFNPEANPDLPVENTGNFAVTKSGDVYMLVFPHEITRYVFQFKPDGSFRSSAKLQPGRSWIPSELAVFPSGELLVSGLAYARQKEDLVKVPFTGIFSTDGALLKEIVLKDDDDLRDSAERGDPRYQSPQNPTGNRAIESTNMEVGDDGYVYLMRWTNPAIIYAVSAGGEVVRRFTVDAGDLSYRPVSMHIAGGRIAVLFLEHGTARDIFKIVDLDGHPVATYEEKIEEKSKGDRLGAAFSCYTVNPEHFVFLSTSDQNSLQVKIAEPR
jgi:hypothetical protein